MRFRGAVKLIRNTFLKRTRTLKCKVLFFIIYVCLTFFFAKFLRRLYEEFLEYEELDEKAKILLQVCFKNLSAAEEGVISDKSGSTPALLDDILYGMPMPFLGQSIFFLDTACRASYNGPYYNRSLDRFNIAELTTRAACAVESAAFHNPNSRIFVLFADPVYWDDYSDRPVMKAILSYSNVQLRNVNLWNFVTNTPIEKFFNTRKIFYSRYLLTHLSDFLRYLTLWHFGGTYLDTDVIVLRNLDEMPPNYAGAETDEYLAAGVINFGFDKTGRKAADYCLDDFKRNFAPELRTQNGPFVLTRAVKRLCSAKTFDDVFDINRCMGFQVYRPEAFYAVTYPEWYSFFDEAHANYALEQLKNSIVAHFWNYFSKNQKLSTNERSAYVQLAAKHCPKVFASSGNFF